MRHSRAGSNWPHLNAALVFGSPRQETKVDIDLLGPLLAKHCGVPVILTAPKPRKLFALLALNANQVVPTGIMMEELWGSDLSGSVATLIHTYILQIGRHHELLGELTGLVSNHRTHEGLHAHLMVALSRSGRRCEAIDIYRRLREWLIDQLGLEPSPRLQQLHYAILISDPSLAEPAGE